MLANFWESLNTVNFILSTNTYINCFKNIDIFKTRLMLQKLTKMTERFVFLVCI